LGRTELYDFYNSAVSRPMQIGCGSIGTASRPTAVCKRQSGAQQCDSLICNRI